MDTDSKEQNTILPKKIRFKKRSSIIRGINSVPPLVISIPDGNFSFNPVLGNNKILPPKIFPSTIVNSNFGFSSNTGTFLKKRGNPFIPNVLPEKGNLRLERQSTSDTIKIRKRNSCVNITNVDFQNSYNCSINCETSNLNIEQKKISRSNSLSNDNQIKIYSDNLSFHSCTKASDLGNTFDSGCANF
jgi:hypothetical protein